MSFVFTKVQNPRATFLCGISVKGKDFGPKSYFFFFAHKTKKKKLFS